MGRKLPRTVSGVELASEVPNFVFSSDVLLLLQCPDYSAKNLKGPFRSIFSSPAKLHILADFSVLICAYISKLGDKAQIYCFTRWSFGWDISSTISFLLVHYFFWFLDQPILKHASNLLRFLLRRHIFKNTQSQRSLGATYLIYIFYRHSRAIEHTVKEQRSGVAIVRERCEQLVNLQLVSMAATLVSDCQAFDLSTTFVAFVCYGSRYQVGSYRITFAKSIFFTLCHEVFTLIQLSVFYFSFRLSILACQCSTKRDQFSQGCNSCTYLISLCTTGSVLDGKHFHECSVVTTTAVNPMSQCRVQSVIRPAMQSFSAVIQRFVTVCLDAVGHILKASVVAEKHTKQCLCVASS